MLLSHLFANKDLISDPDVTMLTADSRTVAAGSVFFATHGAKDSGIRHIPQAVSQGAVAIVVPNDVTSVDVPKNIPVIPVEHPRAEIARCAAVMYPHQPAHNVAVTGTSGKTSTTYFLQQMMNALHDRAVSIGTLGIAGAINEYGSLTTPEAPDLHRVLDRLAHEHIEHVAMEASSQALYQHRMDFVAIKAAAFTNLSRDHLDYHGTMEAYLNAKKILFSRILPDTGTAVLNADDEAYVEIAQIVRARGGKVISYGSNEGADIRLTGHILKTDGQVLDIQFSGRSYSLAVNIAGAFQAGNILCAIGLMYVLGYQIDEVVRVAADLQAPPGRLQPVTGHPDGAAIYVDYAHKPDALLSVLKGLRAHHPRRLVCLFGCGGDRDAGKRPLMGAIAAEHADAVIVTDDNPRSEDAAAIRAAICAAAPNAENIGDRRAAIRHAIQSLSQGDILVVAGKGHETGQIFATHTDPFNDIEEVAQAIALLSPSNTPSSATA